MRTVAPTESAPFGMLLVFPNSYEVGMANLGFQTIYRIVNEFPDWRCERAFLYPDPWSRHVVSLERGTPAEAFHLVGFSCSYELDYPQVVRQIADSGVPLRAADRKEGDPVFILGGAITFYNPLPLAPFFDLILIGEADEVLQDALRVFSDGWRSAKDRRALLEELAEIPGVWSPVVEPGPGRIDRAVYKGPRASPAYSVIVSGRSHMRDHFLVEAGRGCGRRCRFCVASHTYWPVRMWSTGEIVATVEAHNPGARKVGLVGAALSDCPCLYDLCRELVDRGYEISLSSLRMDVVDVELAQVLGKGKVRSLALAPETASARLQRVIRKNLTKESMLEVASVLGRSPMARVKLYFLIGIPFERDEDAEESAEFAVEFWERLSSGSGRKQLSVSVNAFVPKPHTPFQWAPFCDPGTIRNRRELFHRRVARLGGVRLARKSVRNEQLQALLSLSGTEIAPALEYAAVHGVSCHRALRELGMALLAAITRQRDEDEAFPWDFITGGPGKEILLREWRTAAAEARREKG